MTNSNLESKALGLIPMLGPIVYILGVIVVNGQLSEFNFNEYTIFNFAYLKAGIMVAFLLTVLFLIMTVSFTKETMTDNLKKSWPSLLLAMSNVLFVTALCSGVVDNLPVKRSSFANYTLIISVFGYTITRLLTLKKPAATNWRKFWQCVPIICFPGIFLAVLSYHNPVVLNFSVFTLSGGLIFFLAFGAYGDNDYKGRIITDAIGVIALSFFLEGLSMDTFR